MEIKIADTELKEITSIFYRILIPRPIAWVSTISKEGIDNLAPFSFYGGVTANPPIVSLGIGKRKGKQRKREVVEQITNRRGANKHGENESFETKRGVRSDWP